MGRKKFCYWSVADGQHALMMPTCVRSARAAGVTEDFHVWSERAIAGAIAHDAGHFDKHLYQFKFDFLQKQAARLNYDYFVWLEDYMSAEQLFVNPAIVHAMRSKRAMVKASGTCDRLGAGEITGHSDCRARFHSHRPQ
jgi:hypothetical protein